MIDEESPLVKLSFALGMSVYATQEYRDLVQDLIAADVLTERMHNVWALLEPPGIILNPKWLKGFVYFREREYAEAYMAGLITQMGGVGAAMQGWRYMIASIVDPWADGMALVRAEMKKAKVERKLPSWMKLLEGGKDAEEGGEGVPEDAVPNDSGFQVPEEEVCEVLRSDSDDRGGVRTHKEGVAPDVPVAVTRFEKGPEGRRLDVSSSGQAREVFGLQGSAFDLPAVGKYAGDDVPDEEVHEEGEGEAD